MSHKVALFIKFKRRQNLVDKEFLGDTVPKCTQPYNENSLRSNQ